MRRETTASTSQTHKHSAILPDSIRSESVQSSHGRNSPGTQSFFEVGGQPGRDPFEIVVHLIRIASEKKYSTCIVTILNDSLSHSQTGSHFSCHLVEPRSSRLSKSALSHLPLQANPTAVLSDLNQHEIQHIFSSMKQLKNTPLDFVDLSQSQSSITSLFIDNPTETTLQDIDVGKTSACLDGLALAFAALAFGTFSQNNAYVSLAFLELSMKAVENYVGQPTLSLAIAIFLQHVCVLRTGTCNRSRALIAQAVQVAHDIGINRHGRSESPMQTAKLYLVLYFTDQYAP